MALALNTYARKISSELGVFPDEDPIPKPTFVARASNVAKADRKCKHDDGGGKDGGDEEDMEEDRGERPPPPHGLDDDGEDTPVPQALAPQRPSLHHL